VPQKKPSLSLIGVTAGAALIAGCSSSPNGTPAPRSTSSPAPNPTTTSSTADRSAGASPIATAAPGLLPGFAVAVLSLTRTPGDTVRGEFRITNTAKESLNIGPAFIDPAISNPNTTNDAGGITLLDTVNDKKYLVRQDANKDCLCSKNLAGAYIAAGQSTVIFAETAAPPPSTRTVQVSIPHFPPIDNVPIS